MDRSQREERCLLALKTAVGSLARFQGESYLAQHIEDIAQKVAKKVFDDDEGKIINVCAYAFRYARLEMQNIIRNSAKDQKSSNASTTAMHFNHRTFKPQIRSTLREWT